MSERWYYLFNGRSTGPFGVEEFRELAVAGQVNGRTMVWHESMKDWVELESSPLASIMDIPVDGEENAREIATLNKLRLPLAVLSWAAWISLFAAIGTVVVFLTLSSRSNEWNIPWAITSLSVVSASLLVWISVYVCGLIQIFRAWKCIAPVEAAATPAMALVGSVIPVFNIYWYFVSVVELAKTLNAILVREGAKVPLVKENVCRRFALCHALWWLIIPIPAAMICWCMIPGELSRGCIALKQNRMMQRLSDTRKAASAKQDE